jgi:prolyl oligopeptidase
MILMGFFCMTWLCQPWAQSSGWRKRTETDLFLAFQSFLHPTTILRYHCPSGALTLVYSRDVLESDTYETTQAFYTSKDGTRVPCFSPQKGAYPQRPHSHLLYGYGGFLNSMTPFFAIAPLIWLEQGGLYAVACLRGGGEYGKPGIRRGCWSRSKTSLMIISPLPSGSLPTATPVQPASLSGGSNGGLLVAACTAAPELFGAVVCERPVTDMLRYHKFTAGRFWVNEYGNAETTPEHFAFLSAYSPLHNVTPGVAYPHAHYYCRY